MSKLIICDKQWYEISIVDIIIYTIFSSIFNFVYFYIQSEFMFENIRWDQFGILTLIWIIGCVSSRLSYLYANNRTKKITKG